MSAKSHLLLLTVFGVVALLNCCQGSYVITTPRKWTLGETTQVCFSLINATAESQNSATLVVTSASDESEILIPRKEYLIPAGEQMWCERLSIPHLSGHNKGKVKIQGSLAGKEVDFTKEILFATSVAKTFIQTDKYIYKPGQNVQFRILTVTGPFLKISKENYHLIWIETPSGSRIAQWNDVDNSAGLIHESFQLTDEPEEGTYNIKIRTSNGAPTTSRTFKVEEYVLPRFEVTVTAPKYILGTAKDFNFTVCAKYTYGQPVKGNMTLKVGNGGWGRSKITHVVNEKITGCKDVKILADDIAMNGDDYYVYNLDATANVVEEGTDETFEGKASVSIQRTALEFKTIEGNEEFIKPNLPYTGKVKVTFPDGSPAAGELMEVCFSGQCRNITTEASGILEFVIPKYSTRSISIKAVHYPQVKADNSRWRSIMYESRYSHSVKPYYSPSNSSLIIRIPENRLSCNSNGHEHVLPVLFAAVNQTKATFTIQVVSRGQIQFTDIKEYELSSSDLPINAEHLVENLSPPPAHTIVGVVNIPLVLPKTVSPSAKIVVWFTRTDGEVVSDTVKIDIEKCLENNVNLVWSATRVLPGEQARLNISADPDSVCSLGVVDKSVELLSSQNDDLTLAKVFEIVDKAMISEWENAQGDDYTYCRTWIEKDRNSPKDELIPLAETPALEESQVVKRSAWYRPFYSQYIDALKMFDKSGLYILTDLTTETRPCEAHQMYNRVPYSSSSSRRSGIPGPPGAPGAPGATFLASSNTRLNVDEPDLEAHSLNAKDEIESATVQRTYFPETWLWQLKLISNSGVLSEEYTLPDTITEWVGKAVCVNSKSGLGISPRAAITTFTPFFADLTLPPSIKRGEILPVKISVFNYLDQALPVKVVLEESPEYEILEEAGNHLPLGHRIACIPPQEKVVHIVKIQSLVLGDVNITIDSFVDELYPDVCGPEYVISKRDVLIKPIKVEAEGFPREKTWTKYICSKDINENADSFENWRVETPSTIVPDSARGWVTAVGDLLGPTLENLGSLVKMPYGCGEQNMLNFAPNIFILQYLDASNQTTPAIAKKAIEYMKQGYQRELRYRHDDGSFSAFGNSDASGSTWLTAFVLKSFAQARQYVQIDETDLAMSRDWLLRKQLENGCYQSVGKVFHKGMKGGIDGSGSPVPLSSYVLIALLESGEPSSSKSVLDASYCLHADTSKDPYTLALKAYALALSDSPDAKQAIENLINVGVENSNAMYWELPAGSGKSQAVAVETAGYAILAMMTFDANVYQNQARKIVKWISSQRNGQGGFISTQDTVVALQALASFEAHQKNPAVNLVMSVQAEGVEHAFHIDESNKLLQQQVNLPTIPTNVILDMAGEGCALVQAVLRYNVPDATGSEAFSLSVTTETSPDKKCITKKIKACASYLLPDKKSNMAVMEVNLISGYIPHKADLKQIVGYGTGLLKRYEVDGSKIDFYVDEFSPEDICVEFRIIREVDVENAKPGTVKVYDYYQPELSVSQTYVLPPNDDCQRTLVPIEALALEDEIIVAYDYDVQPDYVQPDSTTTEAPNAVRDLVDALDNDYFDYV